MTTLSRRNFLVTCQTQNYWFILAFGDLPHIRCRAMFSVASGISLARRSSTPALPYICRFKVLSRFT
jgi:hypothetical protein